MSPRARVTLVAVLAALAAAGAVVGTVLLQTRDERARAAAARPRAGAPPLQLDLGLRADPEATALRRAADLYAHGRRAEAERIFARYRSPDAQVGAAFSRWPDDALETLRRLAAGHPRSALAELHLGLAFLWSGRAEEATRAWRRALDADPDTPAAVSAADLLHPRTPRGLPGFVPSFAVPAPRGSPRRQLASLARAAGGNDVRAKLVYGAFLQRLGRPVSAERQFAAAARLAPDDPDAQVAAAVGRFTKARPVQAFSRLGPLTRRFPHAPTVRFHLGLLLIWSGDLQGGARQLRLARAQGPQSRIGREATRFLGALVSGGTK